MEPARFLAIESELRSGRRSAPRKRPRRRTTSGGSGRWAARDRPPANRRRTVMRAMSPRPPQVRVRITVFAPLDVGTCAYCLRGCQQAIRDPCWRMGDSPSMLRRTQCLRREWQSRTERGRPSRVQPARAGMAQRGSPRMRRGESPRQELVDWIDDADRVLGPVTRAEMRRKNLRHGTVAILVQRSAGRSTSTGVPSRRISSRVSSISSSAGSCNRGKARTALRPEKSRRSSGSPADRSNCSS